MYPDGLGVIYVVLGIVSIIWLLILSWLVWKNKIFLQNLFPQKGGGFKDRLEEVLAEVKSLEDFKKKSLTNVQKVFLKRYNPYKETGGDQSFSIALLDGRGDGVVLTSLHSRAGTRIFAKPVQKGKERDFQFSEEEREVVTEAMLGDNI